LRAVKVQKEIFIRDGLLIHDVYYVYGSVVYNNVTEEILQASSVDLPKPVRETVAEIQKNGILNLLRVSIFPHVWGFNKEVQAYIVSSRFTRKQFSANDFEKCYDILEGKYRGVVYRPDLTEMVKVSYLKDEDIYLIEGIDLSFWGVSVGTHPGSIKVRLGDKNTVINRGLTHL